MFTRKKNSDSQITYVKIKNRIWNDPGILCLMLLLNTALMSSGFIALCMFTYHLSIKSIEISILTIWGMCNGAIIIGSLTLVLLEIKCVAYIKHLMKIAKRSSH